MKKAIALCLVMLVAGGFAIAGNGNGMGAVKTGLYERDGTEGPADPGSGAWSGFVVLNTDCEGMLWANVVVKGLDEGTYDVYIKTSGPTSGVLVGTVTVNKKGKGQAQFSQDVGVADEKGDTVAVQVVVKQGDSGAILGAATATVDVPLKLPCEME